MKHTHDDRLPIIADQRAVTSSPDQTGSKHIPVRVCEARRRFDTEHCVRAAGGRNLDMRRGFIGAIESNQVEFGLEMNAETIDRLADYYELVQAANPLLHLVAPCSPAEFATRHVLESLTLMEFLPDGARFADVGTGAGLPSIPCLIVGDKLSAVLIESKEKKAKFLEEAIGQLRLSERASVINRQFEEASPEGFDIVTCRALDKMTAKLPRLIKWSRGKRRLLFGGPALADALRENGINFDEKLMPYSEQRFLFVERSKSNPRHRRAA